MVKRPPRSDVIKGLRGSEQHHDLKNRPGEKGKPDHTDDVPENDEEEGERETD